MTLYYGVPFIQTKPSLNFSTLKTQRTPRILSILPFPSTAIDHHQISKTNFIFFRAEDMDGSDQVRSNNTAVAAVVDEKYCGDRERELTVRKTSLFFPGDGYAAYDHDTGELVFRVDTYGRGPSLADNLVLMDPAGAPILTVRRKWPSLHQRWEGFLGDKKEGQKPLFSAKRSSIFGSDRSTIDVETHDADGGREYRVEGSFAQRSCRFLTSCDDRLGDSEEAEVVQLAEIKRKVDACSNVVMGKDVFSLCLRPRFDAAFAMGLVLVLDQICGDDDVTRDIDAAAVAPFG